ncbi:hypothetical protein KC19_3G266000 [Ceratodon purpureus]|uniref:Uncharacterized protein n=1 Tax=Ceratodon purpureus TaxID=3225 RepID=A0A8T0IQA3_CERPU|nr:hypothetical protein KC19_3G266000 [Ceratodon purpureus]
MGRIHHISLGPSHPPGIICAEVFSQQGLPPPSSGSHRLHPRPGPQLHDCQASPRPKPLPATSPNRTSRGGGVVRGLSVSRSLSPVCVSVLCSVFLGFFF